CAGARRRRPATAFPPAPLRSARRAADRRRRATSPRAGTWPATARRGCGWRSAHRRRSAPTRVLVRACWRNRPAPMRRRETEQGPRPCSWWSSRGGKERSSGRFGEGEVVAHLGEQAVELVALVLVHAVHGDAEHALAAAMDVLPDRIAGFGELDVQRAPVAGVGGAHDQSLFLEPVEQAGHRARVQVGGAGQFGHAAGAGGELLQGDVLAEGEVVAEPGQFVRHPRPQGVADLAQEDAERGGAFAGWGVHGARILLALAIVVNATIVPAA